MLKLWLLKLMPFAARWQDTAPAACCGVCGPCLTATATGLSLEVIGATKSGEPSDESEPAQVAPADRSARVMTDDDVLLGSPPAVPTPSRSG